ncbi:hypothetical protein QZM35_17365 [Burkholderia sp. AU45274]|uniref:hypothetical protein n=1 Tax=Burkholderia sp. AU45274 TaxID=3059205 RepID=UPI0026562506|nr:hypothetical protein [Burkholderia sp. AU45274]MDN7489479.1 hypothetical protein [Burkholderia sp. AU45274]
MDTTQKPPELEAYGPFVSARRGDTTYQVADCSVHPHGKEYARLFAAAPRLLDALRDMVSDHAELSEGTLQFARAAIAAATEPTNPIVDPVRHFRACGECL